MSAVSFIARSSVVTFSVLAFQACHALREMLIPRSVEIIGRGCFGSCSSLVTISFELESQLKRIESFAFSDCEQVKALSVPSSVEFIGDMCFHQCACLTDFTIASPSRLRRLLSLPPMLLGPFDVPDSVEVFLDVQERPIARGGLTLSFGKDSRLEDVFVCARMYSKTARGFVRAAHRSLKRIRSRLEFPESPRSLASFTETYQRRGGDRP
jgi:hypothetical protein